MILSVFVFLQENPLRDCHLQTLRRHTRNCESLLFLAEQCILLNRRKNYVSCWEKQCENFYCSFLRAAVGVDSDRATSSLLSRLDDKKQDQWEEAVNSIDFSHSSRKVRSTINKLEKNNLYLHCNI